MRNTEGRLGVTDPKTPRRNKYLAMLRIFLFLSFTHPLLYPHNHPCVSPVSFGIRSGLSTLENPPNHRGKYQAFLIEKKYSIILNAILYTFNLLYNITMFSLLFAEDNGVNSTSIWTEPQNQVIISFYFDLHIIIAQLSHRSLVIK